MSVQMPDFCRGGGWLKDLTKISLYKNVQTHVSLTDIIKAQFYKAVDKKILLSKMMIGAPVATM